MILMIALLFIITSSLAVDQGPDLIPSVNQTEPSPRKSYGLSFNNGCPHYQIVFRCMSACKSYGYQIYRLNFVCKCTCHEMKTSTILPFFKWRTNGTTRAVPKTMSVQLYHVVGTLSPPSRKTNRPTEPGISCPTLEPPKDDNDSTGTDTAGTGGTGVTTEAGIKITNTDDANPSGSVTSNPEAPVVKDKVPAAENNGNAAVTEVAEVVEVPSPDDGA